MDGGLHGVRQVAAAVGQVGRVGVGGHGVVGGSEEGDFCENRRSEIDGDHLLWRPEVD